ncbi:hypothetical protein [Arthrobacter sp. Z4-13]
MLELRGHGRSTSRPGDLSREAFIADVVNVIESPTENMQLGEFFRSWPVPFLSRDKAQFVSRGHDVRRADVPDASHDAHLDTNGAWAAALKSFLSS